MKKAGGGGGGGWWVVSGEWFHFASLPLPYRIFGINPNGWKREKRQKRHVFGWMICSVPWVGFIAVSVNG